MKAKLQSFVVAEGVALDQLTGRTTAYNMVDSFELASTPTVLGRLCAVSLYELADEAESFIERIRALTPDGETTSSSEHAVTLQARNERGLPNTHRSIHVLWRIVLPKEGDYRIVLDRRPPDSDEWEMLSSARVIAIIRPNKMLNTLPAGASEPSRQQ